MCLHRPRTDHAYDHRRGSDKHIPQVGVVQDWTSDHELYSLSSTVWAPQFKLCSLCSIFWALQFALYCVSPTVCVLPLELNSLRSTVSSLQFELNSLSRVASLFPSKLWLDGRVFKVGTTVLCRVTLKLSPLNYWMSVCSGVWPRLNFEKTSILCW